MDSNTFFIIPCAQDVFSLLEENKSQDIQRKIARLKNQLFEYIGFQNVLFQEDATQVSFYFMRNNENKTSS